MNPTQSSEALRVLVIGAGSAGLLMGQVFKKAGISVTVFEQDKGPTERPRDWNMGIYWAQSRITDCLTPELNALVDTVQTDPSYRRRPDSVFPIFNGITGEAIKDVPAPYAIRLRRRPWLDLLRTGLDVRYGKKLASITTTLHTVTATFTDTTTETGTLLIGADGGHSATRAWLFQQAPQPQPLPPSPSPSSTSPNLNLYPTSTPNPPSPSASQLHRLPISSLATLTTLPASTALALRRDPAHPLRLPYSMTVDPRGVWTFVSLHDATPVDDPGKWRFMVLITWPEGMDSEGERGELFRAQAEVQGRAGDLGAGGEGVGGGGGGGGGGKSPDDVFLEKARRLAEPLADPFGAVVRGIPRGTKMWYSARLGYWPTVPWDGKGGRVTLAGDAAHSLTFHRGQGLGNAIADVAELQTHLRNMKAHTSDELAKAVAAYEKEVWQRGVQTVQENIENTMALHDWEKILQSMIIVSGLNTDPSARGK